MTAHYMLKGYVCGPSCFKPSPFEGWASFQQIFNQRPNGCRYAVARLVPVCESTITNPFVVWDLYDDDLIAIAAGMRDMPSALQPPPPVWAGPSAEAVTMKAMALYG